MASVGLLLKLNCRVSMAILNEEVRTEEAMETVWHCEVFVALCDAKLKTGRSHSRIALVIMGLVFGLSPSASPSLQ